jgi:hypothetical protein
MSVVSAASALVLLASGCGDDSTLEELIDDIESEQSEPAATSSTSPADSPQSDSDGTTDQESSAEPGSNDGSDPASDSLTPSERALIDYLAAGGKVEEDESRCLLESLETEGIEPDRVVADSLDVEDEIIVTDAILACFEEPQGLKTFVENVASGFADIAPFEVEPDAAACAIAAIVDHGATAAELAGSDISPELIDELNACIGIDPSIVLEPGDVYGDNPLLDGLWDECESGIMASCDELFSISQIGSQYEAYGATCGDREPDASGGACDIPFSYGDNADLDAYWDACEAGDGSACDDLYFESPIGSEYEAFGASCGNRHEGTQSYCVDLLG